MLPACGHSRDQVAGDPVGIPRPETFGHAALRSEASRTIEIHPLDEFRFDPAQIVVRPGEVVTFRVVNDGRLGHEFTIGGPVAQDLHDAQMASMEMSGSGSGMAMSSSQKSMHTPHDPAHQKYMKNLTKRIAVLDRTAAASESMHIPPGEMREVTWSFSGGDLPQYGCHVSGHWQGGMKGSSFIPSSS